LAEKEIFGKGFEWLSGHAVNGRLVSCQTKSVELCRKLRPSGASSLSMLLLLLLPGDAVDELLMYGRRQPLPTSIDLSVSRHVIAHHAVVRSQ